MIALGRPVFMKGIRHMILKWRFFWRARILREYDIVIFSGDCLGALRHVRNDAKVYYYCHTPPRYLYDFRERYLTSQPVFFRPIFRIAFSFFARVYEGNIQKFDLIFSNSQTVEKRLLEYTKTKSTVIYPPTDMSRFSSLEAQNHHLENPEIPNSYFLSWARLSPPKRVNLIVDAFLDMPEQNLIFCYGKNDPMKGEILKKVE